MRVPLGDGEIEFELPGCSVDVAERPGGTAVDVPAATERALDEPLGASVADVVDPDDAVAIVVTDVTRATPDEVLLDALFDRLDAIGVDRDSVTIVVGLGLHRPMDEAELTAAYGEYADLAVNHDAEAAVDVGRVDGIPVEVHPAVAAADAVLATGMVEPHQYAGFSGGAKTVVVGAGGEPLIRHTHGPSLLGEPGVRLGRVAENPFREFVDRAGDLAGPDFCVNVTAGPEGVLDVAAGDPCRVVHELAAAAREALSVPVDDEYDAVVAGVGAPKDANLYQASRAATYVALGDRKPLRDGGRIVIPARLDEGVGEGSGEQRTAEWLREASDPESLYDAMADGYEPGAQRAFVLARVLREHDVYVTDVESSDVAGTVEECLLQVRETVPDAIQPGSDVLVVPDAIDTLLVRSVSDDSGTDDDSGT